MSQIASNGIELTRLRREKARLETQTTRRLAELGNMVYENISEQRLDGVADFIMLFHTLSFSTGWNLHGSALMPVFFCQRYGCLDRLKEAGACHRAAPKPRPCHAARTKN